MLAFYGVDRTQPKEFLLNKINTGTVSRRAYGVRVRQVNVTRGNRQGNTAFDEPGNPY